MELYIVKQSSVLKEKIFFFLGGYIFSRLVEYYFLFYYCCLLLFFWRKYFLLLKKKKKNLNGQGTCSIDVRVRIFCAAEITLKIRTQYFRYFIWKPNIPEIRIKVSYSCSFCIVLCILMWEKPHATFSRKRRIWELIISPVKLGLNSARSILIWIRRGCPWGYYPVQTKRSRK